jgi:two-component system response regulator AgrA
MLIIQTYVLAVNGNHYQQGTLPYHGNISHTYIEEGFEMVPVYICEDNKIALKRLEKIVLEIIKAEGIKEMSIVCLTSDPMEILNRFDPNITHALYFLDIDLGLEAMDGIELASQIRKRNPYAQIVMITGYNFALETYQKKIGIKDYILKGDLQKMTARVRDCLLDASEHIVEQTDSDGIYLTIHNNYTKITIDVSEIYYIEVTAGTQRKLSIHKSNGTMNASATLKELIGQASGTFFQCHKSYMINLNHVDTVDIGKRIVVMDNGAIIPVSLININKLKKVIEVIKSK